MNTIKTVFEFDPYIVEEFWDFQNNIYSPYILKVNSSKKVYWKCYNHMKPFYMSVSDVIQRRRWCSYCNSSLLLKGYNDLASKFPAIFNIWDYNKNTLLPSDLMYGSKKEIWLKCDEKPHSYKTSPTRITSSPDRKCPICKGKYADWTNNITHNRPKIAQCWDYNKNNIDPSDVTIGSSLKAHFIGKECKHSFSKVIKHIKDNDYPSCPFCTSNNTKVLTGFNDFATVSPHLLKEWDHNKNNIHPSDITYASGRKCYWVCKKNKTHKWIAQLSNRTLLSSGCPHCYKTSSKMEDELANFISSHTDVEIKRNIRNVIYPFELDIYIPSFKLAIEFNGTYWHSELAGKDKKYHHKKWNECKLLNIELVQIWEHDWIHKNNIIKKMVVKKINESYNMQKISTIKNNIKHSQTNREIIEFYENNHINGFNSKESLHFTHSNKSNIEDIISIQKYNDSNAFQITQFLLSKNNSRVFNSMLNSIQEKLNPSEIIIETSNCFNENKILIKNGFEKIKDVPPKSLKNEYTSFYKIWNSGYSLFRKIPTN